jgi:hypothetical protein
MTEISDMWRKVKMEFELPQMRTHSMVYVEPYFYIFGISKIKFKSFSGGWHESIYMNHFFQFNTLTNYWKIIKCEYEPKPRSNHTFVVLQNKFQSFHSNFRYLILFGGFNGLQTNNDVFVFDLKTEKWNLAFPFENQPKERDSHSCCVRKETNEMIVFGGRALGYQSTVFLNDLHSMTLKFDDFGVVTQPSCEWKSLS